MVTMTDPGFDPCPICGAAVTSCTTGNDDRVWLEPCGHMTREATIHADGHVSLRP